MERSQHIGRLARALSVAQGKFSPIKKSAQIQIVEGGQTKIHRYAELKDVIEATRPALAASKLALSQTLAQTDNKIEITSMLLHTSGEWIQYTLAMPIPGGSNRIHSIGAAITYGRRYAMETILGVAGEDDSDGIPPGVHEPHAGEQSKPKPPMRGPRKPSFDEEYRAKTVEIMKITGTKNVPIWSDLELMDIEADALAEEARGLKSVEPLEVLLLRARCMAPYRGTEQWYKMLPAVLKLQRGIPELKAMAEEAGKAAA